MKFNFRRNILLLAVISAFVFQSCKDDPKPVVKAGESGFFIVNEGGYNNSNTSISFYEQKADTVINNIFTTTNGRLLGDQAQSMTVFESKGYIVVQHSAKIEVINADDFSSIATVEGDLPSPRYFIGISSTKGYVSDWGEDGLTGTVKVIDLNTYKVIKSISTGAGANSLLKVGSLVYVTNAGGFGKDNTVKVIDSSSDAIVASITVGDNPSSLQRDKDGNIWILSGGAFSYNSDYSIDEDNSTKGSISKVNTSNSEVFRLPMDRVSGSQPKNLIISPDGTKLYYTFDGAVYMMSSTASTLPTKPYLEKNYYGLAVDPFNGNIIGCEAPNFSSAGSIDIYDASGNQIGKSRAVGIAPNGCAFK